MSLASHYAYVPWSGAVDGIPDIVNPYIESLGWSVEESSGTLSFKYGETTMLEISASSTATIHYGGTTKSYTIQYDSSGAAMYCIHVTDNGFIFRNGANTLAIANTNTFIFTKDNKDNPACVIVNSAAKSGSTPAYSTVIAWNDTDVAEPFAATFNDYYESTQAELVPFVIETEDEEDTRYIPTAFFLTYTNLQPTTGQLTFDFIPIQATNKVKLFYNGFVAMA